MIHFTPQVKRSFAITADSGPLMRRPTCTMWRFVRFRHRERKLTSSSPRLITESASINASVSARHSRTRTRKAEQDPSSGYWSRISRIAKAIVVELGKNSEVGTYSLYTAQSRPSRAITAGESLIIDKRGHRKTTSGIADPYGLINRWKTRTEIPSQELLVSEA